MNPFQSYTFSWVEIGIFKLAMIAIGVALGAYFHATVNDYLEVVIAIAIISSTLIAYIALQQAIENSK